MTWLDFKIAAIEWCAKQGETLFVWEGQHWKQVEHLIHEFSHAVHLNMDPSSSNLSQEIGGALKYRDKMFRLRQEEYTLVTEFYVCEDLDIPLDKGDMQEMAQVQEVEWEVDFNNDACIASAKTVLNQMVRVLL